MIYRNKKTGFTFENVSEISGEEWEIVSPTPTVSVEVKTEVKPKRRRVKKDNE